LRGDRDRSLSFTLRKNSGGFLLRSHASLASLLLLGGFLFSPFHPVLGSDTLPVALRQHLLRCGVTVAVAIQRMCPLQVLADLDFWPHGIFVLTGKLLLALIQDVERLLRNIERAARPHRKCRLIFSVRARLHHGLDNEGSRILASLKRMLLSRSIYAPSWW
jgi:hypothetical protein